MWLTESKMKRKVIMSILAEGNCDTQNFFFLGKMLQYIIVNEGNEMCFKQREKGP